MVTIYSLKNIWEFITSSHLFYVFDTFLTPFKNGLLNQVFSFPSTWAVSPNIYKDKLEMEIVEIDSNKYIYILCVKYVL